MTVRNQGDGQSSPTMAGYYRSPDSIIATHDTKVGTDSVEELAASGSSTISITLTAPSTAGIYRYGACVDSVPLESNTGNNCSSAVTVTVGSPTSPDLVISEFVVDNANPVEGNPIVLTATVKNQGDGRTSGGDLVHYRSIDSTITTSDIELLGTFLVNGLGPSDTARVERELTPPRYPDNRTLYYGACVESIIGESDTSNNCSTGVAVNVQEPPRKPDLIVIWNSNSVSDNRPPPGGRFTLRLFVRNIGNGTASGTTLHWYSSSDSTVTASDEEVGTDSISSLGAGLNSPGALSLIAPSSPGTYYYGACVDAVTDESDTTNNCSSAIEITVDPTSVPDLVVESISVSSAKPDAGDSLTLSANVVNRGKRPQDLQRFAITVRPTQPSRATTRPIGTDSVSGLVVSDTSSESIDLTAPSSPGTYYYGACVDAMVDESDTKNNCSSAVLVTVGAASAPGSPTGLTATADGETEIDLSWTAPSDDGGADITGYKIEVSTDGSSWSDLVADTGSTSTSYSHSGLTANSTP